MSRSFVHLHCHSHYSLLDGASPIDKLVVTNTIPPTGVASDKVVVLSVARLLAQAIRSIHEETSVSKLFV